MAYKYIVTSYRRWATYLIKWKITWHPPKPQEHNFMTLKRLYFSAMQLSRHESSGWLGMVTKWKLHKLISLSVLMELEIMSHKQRFPDRRSSWTERKSVFALAIIILINGVSLADLNVNFTFGPTVLTAYISCRFYSTMWRRSVNVKRNIDRYLRKKGLKGLLRCYWGVPNNVGG